MLMMLLPLLVLTLYLLPERLSTKELILSPTQKKKKKQHTSIKVAARVNVSTAMNSCLFPSKVEVNKKVTGIC
jgi:hypothetical protein